MQPDANITLHHLTQGVVLPKLVFPEAVLGKKSTPGVTPTNRPSSAADKSVFCHHLPQFHTISDAGEARVTPLAEMRGEDARTPQRGLSAAALLM